MRKTVVAIADLPLGLQYAHYVVSACRLVSLASWHAEGRPNPFTRREDRKPREPLSTAELKAFCRDVQPEPLSRREKSNVVWLHAA